MKFNHSFIYLALQQINLEQVIVDGGDYFRSKLVGTTNATKFQETLTLKKVNGVEVVQHKGGY